MDCKKTNERNLKLVFLMLMVLIMVVTVVAYTRATRLKQEETDDDEGNSEIYNIPLIFNGRERSAEQKDFIYRIKSKIDYFIDLGVDTIWLSPIFTSPMKDFGYDISNFYDIDSIFGSMKDMDDLIATLHSKGLKLILDFVPNHTSDQHQWFRKSLKNHSKYADYYVWKDAVGHDEKGHIPPNNWLSNFRNSAWEWSEERQQFYLHQFLKEQPDLNYRNPEVREEMLNILKFWLDKGIDGFRMDAVKFLVEDENVYEAVEPLANQSRTTDPTDYDYLEHIYTTNMPETFDIIREWRKLMDKYPNRLLMAEVYDDIEKVMKYYGTIEYPLADFPFNFELIGAFSHRNDISGTALKSRIETWIQNMPVGKSANWVLGNHDIKRVASRLGKDLVDSMNMILLLLPGTAVTYQGEEIGMEDATISFEDTLDPYGLNFGPEGYANFSRDPQRTPMQWDDTPFSGFTTSKSTWLPINDTYLSSNIKIQSESQQSHLKVYKQLSKLRKELTFRKGSLSYPVINKDIFSFMRTYDNCSNYLVVINTALTEVHINLLEENTSLPHKATLLIRSSFDTKLETLPGSSIDLSTIQLLGGEGIVLEFQPKE